MTGLDAVSKGRIIEVLSSISSTRDNFSVQYDGEKNPVATITFAGSPEYRFVINSTGNGAFTTDERPGVHADATETFRRANLEECLGAVQQWAERIKDSQRDWILDQFGGVADMNPSLGNTRK